MNSNFMYPYTSTWCIAALNFLSLLLSFHIQNVRSASTVSSKMIFAENMLSNQVREKPKILCLHGRGASGKILKELMKDWPESLMKMMDLVFLDAPFPIEDSGLIGRFDPPYYEWFKDSHVHEKEFKNYGESIAYVEDHMIKWGPFDGVLGTSQGSIITAALPGMQREGVAFTKVPKVKFVILISGYKMGGKYFPACPQLAENAFSVPIDLPSLFMIGEKDPTKEEQLELLESFVRPTLYYHHGGHGVPRTLDENAVKIVLEFLNKIQALLLGKENPSSCETSNLCFHYCCFLCSLFTKKRWISSKEARIDNVA